MNGDNNKTEKKERILVVDDDATSRKPCSIYLKNRGYRVAEAGTGEEAVKKFKENSYALVITDLNMPGIDGIEVLRQIKKISSDCPVIIMTAYATVETGIKSMKLGAYDYLVKPVKLDELHMKITRSLKEKRLSEKVKKLDETLALYEITKKMFKTVELQELLDLIVDTMMKILNADRASLMLLNNDNKLYIPVSRGISQNIQQKTRLEPGEGIAGKIMETKEPVILNTDSKENWPFEKVTVSDANINSAIICPLLTKNKVLGVINLSRVDINKNFTEDDLHKAVIFTSHITSAIENANLFERLQKEKGKIEAMFSGMGDGAVITDSEGCILTVNEAAQSLLGCKKDDVLDKKFSNIIEDFEASPQEKTTRNKKEIITFELYKKKKPPLYLSVLNTKIPGKRVEGGQIFILRDITAEKKDRLLKQNFFASVSHKLKTPLTGIISTVNILKNSNDIKESEETLKMLESSAWELSEIVDKLLSFTTLETNFLNLNRESATLRDLLSDCINSFSSFAEENNVKIEVANNIDNLPKIFVDISKIEEAIENIIENGIKFNSKEEKKINIKAYKHNSEFIRVEILDNGPGIPVSEQDNIFKKFYQAEEYFTGQVKGAGLGLAAAKKIIEAHRGKIWVQSQLNEGSNFIFMLPRIKDKTGGGTKRN
ncbi:MAG: response regulator [Elusimicrobiota bacterium]